MEEMTKYFSIKRQINITFRHLEIYYVVITNVDKMVNIIE